MEGLPQRQAKDSRLVKMGKVHNMILELLWWKSILGGKYMNCFKRKRIYGKEGINWDYSNKQEEIND